MEGIKGNDFKCPVCLGHLNVAGKLIFATRTKSNHRGLIMLSPNVGDYNYAHHDNYHLKKGELVDFHCPICTADLTASNNKEHAMVLMVNEEDRTEFELYFSKEAGNKSTYIVSSENVESYGEDALDYEDLSFDFT